MSTDGDTVGTVSTGLARQPGELVNVSKTKNAPTIADFMAKPHVVSTGVFTPSSLANDVIASFSVSTVIYTNPLWINKLRGYSLWRGTAVVRVQVNASPFHAGLLLLHFLPQYKDMTRHYSRHNFNLQTKTQQPSLVFDIQDSEATFRIPYVAPTSYFRTSTGKDDWGSFFLTSYSPLATGATSPQSVDYTIWLSFEDFEVEGPTAQMAVRKGQKGSSKGYVVRNPTEAESRPVSQALGYVSKAATSLTSIPILAPFAGPVAWFTNALSGAASAFGWSKPTDDTSHLKMSQDPHMYSTNSNGFDMSAPMGLLADGKLAVHPDVSGVVEDEMSLNFIKTRPAFGRSYEWTSTDSGLIITQPIEPKMMSTVSVSPTATTFTPVGFLANLFRFYRGSLKIRFRFVKTPFHSGRLLFTFDPVAAPGSVDATDYTFRTIVDIRETREVVLSFPYMQNTQYVDQLLQGNMGTMRVYVLNELRFPPTVASSVQVIMEAFAGDDLEFHWPTTIDTEPILAQGPDDEPIVDSYIGEADPVALDPGASMYCTGELVLSLNQLLKRFVPVKRADVLNEVGTIRPFFLGALRSDGAVSVTDPRLGGDYISLFASMFAYMRGGVRLKVLASGSGTLVRAGYFPGAPLVAVVTSTASTLQKVTSYNSQTAGLSTVLQLMPQRGGCTVQIPYQATTPFVSTKFDTQNTYEGDLQACFSYRMSGTVASDDLYIYRAAADDFQFSYFLGAPVLGLPI